MMCDRFAPGWSVIVPAELARHRQIYRVDRLKVPASCVREVRTRYATAPPYTPHTGALEAAVACRSSGAGPVSAARRTSRHVGGAAARPILAALATGGRKPV